MKNNNFASRSCLLQTYITCIFHIFLPLSLGGLIYIAYRPKTLVMFTWFNRCGLQPLSGKIAAACTIVLPAPPEWVVYSLPDALWIYSLVMFLGAVWRPRSGRQLLLWAGVAFVLSIGSELLQLFHIIGGTFCLFDTCSYVIAIILSCFLVVSKPEVSYD
ncbi:hypothetical protein JXO52_05335 [bacterium]|nr:hypothetical protein [bacterium]